ncbi:MAG: hypothetical protein K0S55_177 [Clostridia bacterium]|nr:hypothetical protein [Clostridia bacterium]
MILNYLKKSKIFLLLLSLIFILFLLSACTEKSTDIETVLPDNEKPIEDLLKSVKDGISSLFLSSYQVNKYFAANYYPSLNGAVGDGVADDTKAIQSTLDKAEKNGGGVVYLKRGIYRITAPITIPENVTLRGDFISPTAKRPTDNGTLLLVEENSITLSKDLIKLKDNSSISDLSIWYESQQYENVKEYTYTISQTEGKSVSITNIAIINTFRGILLSSPACTNVLLKNIYLTALNTGIKVDYCIEKLDMENINFSPVYWINNSLTPKPENFIADNLNNYLNKCLTSIIIGTVKDMNIYNINLDTSFKGIEINVPYEINGKGFFSNINIKNSFIPLFLQNVSKSGIAFLNSVFRTTDLLNTYTIKTSDTFKSTVVFNSCVFPGQPVNTVNATGKGNFSFMNCNFISWREAALNITGGLFTSVNNNFVSDRTLGIFDTKTVGLFCNNLFSTDLLFEGGNVFETQSETEYIITPIKDDWVSIDDASPHVRNVIYNAKDFGLDSASPDNATAIQQAINKAYNEGGGVVFIPEGQYNVKSTLRLRPKVRLSGVSDDEGKKYSTVLKIEKDITNTAYFIYLDKNTSVTDIVIEYIGSYTLTDETAPTSYAFSSSQNSSDIYLENITLKNTHNGISLQNAKNVIIENVKGTVLKNGISLNECTGILVKNAIFDTRYANDNIIAYQKLLFHGIIIKGGSDIKLLNNSVTNADYAVYLDSEKFDILSEIPKLIINALFAKNVYAGVCVNNYDYAVIMNTAVDSLIFDKNAYHFITLNSNKGRTDLYNLIGSGEIKGSIYMRSGQVMVQSSIFNELGDVAVKTDGGTIDIFGSVFMKTPGTYHVEATEGVTTFMGNLVESSKDFAGVDEKYLKKYINKEAAYVDYYNIKRIDELNLQNMQ